MRIDNGSHLSIRAIACKQGDLDLGLVNNTGMLVWIFEVLAVVEELLQVLQGS